ncbi:MAG: transglutaminase domain-containing protein [Fibrobacter sp.]|nr:transglutaminase domain-containing protein [Fibrobacter sp.]
MKLLNRDFRNLFRIFFLCGASLALGLSFDCLWLGILFTLLFSILGVKNYIIHSKQPRYNKVFAYGAILPLAVVWLVTPGVENGINSMMILLPAIYLLFLAALQERSRNNGGHDAFVMFDGMAALLLSMFMAQREIALLGLLTTLFALLSVLRPRTAIYKYVCFFLLYVGLAAISYGGWQVWKHRHHHYGMQMAEDYYQRHRMMGFDPVAALGSFSSNFRSKYNNQVVLRVWDKTPFVYLKAASYEKYVAGIWKLPQRHVATMEPAYYQVDYPVFETSDSVTYRARSVWVQSTLDNFGFLFAPYHAVGYSVKDVDSLNYFAGGMVNGLNSNGKRSDWFYYVCESDCSLPDSLLAASASELMIQERYHTLLDSVILDAELDTLSHSQAQIVQKLLAYLETHFTYSLQVPGVTGYMHQKDPLFSFIESKQGYCEYYATLTALILRRLGIPTRYVTGFARPEKNDNLPYVIFRRKHSHAWVEANIDNRWIVVDPTPMVEIPVDAGWMNKKWEGVKGRLGWLLHLLKEGGWRRYVDRLQLATQKMVASPILYLGLLLLFALVVFLRYKRGGFRRKASARVGKNAIYWAKKLENAEKMLHVYDFRRLSYQTVGCFIKQIEKKVEEGNVEVSKQQNQDRLKESLAVLKEYEKNRWRY